DPQEVLVPAHCDAVLRDATEPGHYATVERFSDLFYVFYRNKIQSTRLQLQAIDPRHGVTVVHQVMGKREAGGPEPDHQHLASRIRARQRTAQVQRVPASEQRVDFETPGQFEHVLEGARLRLRNVDGRLLLVDAGLHAVVADTMAGRRHHRVVHADDRQRGNRLAARLDQMEFGNLLLKRAAGERDAELRLAEPGGRLFFPQALRAGILRLLMAPDAIVGLVERSCEIGTL